ncbi:MAG: hypothetical protein ACMXX8_03655 [Candidatus Woesearchaeota archaeon]
MKNKMFIILIYLFTLLIPIVSADIIAGPEIIIIPAIALTIITGLIFGAVFLIKWIIKKLRTEE